MGPSTAKGEDRPTMRFAICDLRCDAINIIFFGVCSTFLSIFFECFFFTFFFLKIVFYFEIWINSNELSHSVDRMLWFVVRCVYFSIWFSRHPLSRLQMQVPLWDNRSGIPARDAWGRFVAERHRVQWPNLTFEMAASVRFSSKRYCRAEIVMFCLFFCISVGRRVAKLCSPVKICFQNVFAGAQRRR